MHSTSSLLQKWPRLAASAAFLRAGCGTLPKHVSGRTSPSRARIHHTPVNASQKHHSLEIHSEIMSISKSCDLTRQQHVAPADTTTLGVERTTQTEWLTASTASAHYENMLSILQETSGQCPCECLQQVPGVIARTPTQTSRQRQADCSKAGHRRHHQGFS
jgi:hypothetical protein